MWWGKPRQPGIMDTSYQSLRLGVGVLGVTLPFILRAGSAIWPPDPYSVSDYYYTAMRNVLVAVLCALGVVLVTYRGHDKLDERITNIAGLATIGVALFPASSPAFRPAWVGQVHPYLAGVALVSQALMALQFCRSVPREEEVRWQSDAKRMLRALLFDYQPPVNGAKLARNRVYSACAWTILAGVALSLVQASWPASLKARTQWLFWFESLSIVAFGIAWLVKWAGSRSATETAAGPRRLASQRRRWPPLRLDLLRRELLKGPGRVLRSEFG